LQTAGGELLDEPVIAGGIPAWKPEPITLRFEQVSRILGIAIPPAECVNILERLQLEQVGEATHESAAFVPPPWRRDLTREIDLIEEVARIHGYDQIPEDRAIPVVAATASLEDRISEKVRRVLTAAGFCEAMTMSFITEPMAGLFTPHPDAAQLEVTPAAGEYGSLLRQTLVPSLLVCRRDNERNGNLNAELYEMARVFLAANPDDPATQPRRLAFVSGRSFAEMRGIVDAIATRLSRDATITLRPSSIPQFIDGRGAELLVDGQPCGWMGELDRDGALKDLKFREAVTAVELDMQVLTEVADLSPTLRPLPQYPAVSRDLNFILDEEVTWERLEKVVRQAGGDILASVRFVEQYRGKHIPAGRKSYVLSVAYRADDRTLTGDEVDAAQQQVIQACEQQLSATLR
ncbi:MAG: phenylalanine--tRNA ligase subunit beta, partial [Maioricimonas sp. JB049]